MHVRCAHSQLLWPHYRQAVHEAARHLPSGDKALWVASWRSAGATVMGTHAQAEIASPTA